MMQKAIRILALACVCSFSLHLAMAQQPQAPTQQSAAAVMAEPEAPRVVLQAETTASVLRLIKFSGALRDRAGNPRSGSAGLTFALYKDQQGGSPLWLEVHNAQLDEQGRYTVLLGSTKSEGLPLELFSTGEARWLGVQLNLPGEEEQPRVLLVSVPYALKAADAETLGGKPPSAFLLAEKAEGGEAAGKPEAGKEAVKEGPPREGVVGPINGEGTAGFVAKFTGANAIGNGTIFDNGFVGIGTTSPTARLHIFEPEPTQNANVRLMGSGQTGSWMDIFAGTAVGFGLFGYGNQPFLFGVGAVERMRITPTGEVGLGTTSPNAKLSVGSGSIADASVPVQISTGTPGTVSYYGANKNGGYGLLLGYENGGSLGTGGVLRMVPADPLLFFVNNTTEAMRITSAGNVGIGTATPNSHLSLGGDTFRAFGMERRTVPDAPGNSFFIRAGGATALATNRSGGGLFLSGGFSTGSEGSEILFQTATGGASGTADRVPTTKMRIDSNGNVLLNGDTPKSLQMESPSVPNSEGNRLTVGAGHATSSATNKLGGTLALSGGISTGSAGSEIEFQTATPAASGTALNFPTSKMRIQSDGSVLLNGDTPKLLQMESTSVPNSAGNRLTVGAGHALSGGTNKAGGTLALSGGISTGSAGSEIQFATATPGVSGTALNFRTTKMTILGNGNVGIGTGEGSANARLHVATGGDIHLGTVSNPAFPNNTSLYIENNGGDANNSFRIDGAANTLYMIASSQPGALAGAGITFRTGLGGAGETDRMLISAGGNVVVNRNLDVLESSSITGNLTVGGTLSKAGGMFRIDHPLDPANKYLSHSFVESPDMMNIYNGNARLDARGEAWVELPEWFEAGPLARPNSGPSRPGRTTAGETSALRGKSISTGGAGVRGPKKDLTRGRGYGTSISTIVTDAPREPQVFRKGAVGYPGARAFRPPVVLMLDTDCTDGGSAV